MMLKVILLLQVVSALTRFSCDFETQASRGAWTLNPGGYGAECANRWYMGRAGASEGEYGLFISNNGQDAKYQPTIVGGVEAYTTIEMQKDKYILSFDWQSKGLQLETTGNYLDRLYVCWVPTKDEDGNEIKINSSKSGLPMIVDLYALQPDGTKQKYLAGSRSWSTATCTIDSVKHFVGQGPYRLVFVWTNDDSVAVNPPAMVDNIVIQPYTLCPAPTNFTYTLLSDAVQLNWEGTAEKYEYRCYSHEAERTYSGETTNNSVTIDNLPEGRIDFYVRAVCGENHSVTVSTTGLIYYPGKRCINFLDLKEENCYIGDIQKESTEVPIVYTHALVDYGPESEYSRHTVHYDRKETDPMTQDKLKTVPDGELASVRLGNKRTGSQTERVEYDLHINARVNPVLVLKYAIVMENPDDHKTYEQPRFKLRILKNGESVGNHCAEADFTADHVDETKDPSWHRWNPGTPAAQDIVWKDWTTVGVDLSEYDGEDLKIQLTSYDCSLTGHFGYVYFTLSCSDGKFEDMSCGQINPIFYAPAGFNYRWYKKSDPTKIISRRDTLEVGYRDTTVYGCDMIFPKDTTCYFTLYADAMARFPIPEMRYTVSHAKSETGECTNLVTFYEKSHILVHNHISNRDFHDYSQFPTETYWYFDDEEKPRRNVEWITKEYPAEGGTFSVTMKAIYQTCDSTDTFTFTLPDVRPSIDTIQRQICIVDTPFIYPSPDVPDHISQSKSGLCPPYTFVSQYGCDSTIVVDLTVSDKYYTYVDTIIHQGASIMWLGKEISEPDTYVDTVASHTLCDSIITLRLATVKMDSIDAVCAGEKDYRPTYVISSPWVSYQGLLPAQISNEQLQIPDIYRMSALFVGGTAKAQMPLWLHVLYPEGVVVQRWNDVLAVRNSAYNGGYEFVAFQWLKNNVEISGETSSLLYVAEGLDPHATYSVLLTRDDGLVLGTCPYQPQYIETENIPKIVDHDQSIKLCGKGKAVFYSTMGQCVSDQDYNDSYVVAPHSTGVYLLLLNDMNSNIRIINMIVR